MSKAITTIPTTTTGRRRDCAYSTDVRGIPGSKSIRINTTSVCDLSFPVNEQICKSLDKRSNGMISVDWGDYIEIPNNTKSPYVEN